MKIIIFAITLLSTASCTHHKNGLNLPHVLNQVSWIEYLKKAETEKNTCRSAAAKYSDLWFSYKTPGTMNLLPGVDVIEYLAEIKLELEDSKNDLRKMCSNSALLSDLDVLEKSGLGKDHVISIKDYFAEASRQANEK